MKKFLTIPFLILAMFVFISCVEEDDLEEGLSGDTTPAGDTTPSDPSDTATPSDPTDTGDTNPADDTGDTTSAETSDTTPGECTPQCDGKECGSDGCGGQCGTCGEGRICDAGTFTCKCTGTCDGIHCGARTDNGCGEPCGCKSNETCGEETGLCECVPHCEEGWECGDDGCGGPCGEGCGEEGICIESAHTCKYCTKVTLAPVADSLNSNGYIYFKTLTNAYTPNTGDPSQDDKYTLGFKSDAAKAGDTIDLSTNIDHCNGKDLTRDTKAVCFYIQEDHKASNDPKRFLPQSGTVKINSVEAGSQLTGNGAKINADISGIKMYEIVEEVHGAIQGGNKYYFKTNGDCIIVNDTTLTYPAE